MELFTLGIDLGKTTFHLVGMNQRGEVVSTRRAGRCWKHAIENGRGGCYLRLTPEQYRRLRRHHE
jgi:hypothetical protein